MKFYLLNIRNHGEIFLLYVKQVFLKEQHYLLSLKTYKGKRKNKEAWTPGPVTAASNWGVILLLCGRKRVAR